MTDDPQMISNQGLVFVQQKMGRDWAGGTDGSGQAGLVALVQLILYVLQ